MVLKRLGSDGGLEISELVGSLGRSERRELLQKAISKARYRLRCKYWTEYQSLVRQFAYELWLREEESI